MNETWFTPNIMRTGSVSLLFIMKSGFLLDVIVHTGISRLSTQVLDAEISQDLMNLTLTL